MRAAAAPSQSGGLTAPGIGAASVRRTSSRIAAGRVPMTRLVPS